MKTKERYVLWWRSPFDLSAASKSNSKLGTFNDLASLVDYLRSWKQKKHHAPDTVSDDKFIVEILRPPLSTGNPYMSIADAKMQASDQLDGAMKAIWKAILTRR